MKNSTTRVGERVWLTSVVPALLALLVAGLLASAGCASVAYLPGADARSSHQPTDEKLPGFAPQPSDDKVLEAYGKLPLGFVPNRGQVGEGQVRYHAQGAAFGFYFTPMGVRLSFFEDASGSEASSPTGEPSTRGAALALDFLDANPAVKLEARKELPGKVNYLRGSDRGEWQTDLPSYGELVYRDLWPGVDMAVRGEDGVLKYEFLLEPGARTEDIGLDYRGAESLSLDEEGNLLISTPVGELTDSAPMSYQIIGGERVPVESRFALLGGGAGRYGFKVGTDYDPRYPLVVDPGLAYSTFLNGTAFDFGRDIRIDRRGNAYVMGRTASPDFPTTPGVFDVSPNGSLDAFVAKLDPTGSELRYSTFLGGTNDELGLSIAIDRRGSAYLSGQTASPDFPTTPGAFDPTFNGGTDAFATKLDPTGSELRYSTFLGGTNNELGESIAIDRRGSAYVTGPTASPEFPTTPGAFDPTFKGDTDAFATKLDPTGSELRYSTFFGGTALDYGRDITVNRRGNAYVTGRTASPDFPTTPDAFDVSPNGSLDAFATKLDPTGSELRYSTFLGGGASDQSQGIAIDRRGSAYLSGQTASPDFPTTPGAFDPTFNGDGAGDDDVFAAKLDPTGSELRYSTFLGGTVFEQGQGIAIDRRGNAYIAGRTTSPDFPTTPDAFDRDYNGIEDAFVAKLNSGGSDLLYSTFLGGLALEQGFGIAVDRRSNAYVTGRTASPDFPTTPDAFDPTFNLGDDAFVTKFALGQDDDEPGRHSELQASQEERTSPEGGVDTLAATTHSLGMPAIGTGTAGHKGQRVGL